MSATDFSYALTTQDDPVVPGQAMTFLVTVANQTNAPQSTTLTYLVPANTRFLLGNGFSDGPGTTRTVSFSNVPAGDSKATLIRLYVLNGSDTTPVDGTTITLTLNDNARALMFTRSVVVQSAPAADLKLSTNQASVARGGQFSYALAYHNASAADLANATLSLPLPAGVSLVSADHGGTLVNGAVQWTLPTVARRSAGQVQATFTAPVSGNAPLVLDATFADANTNVLAEASDTQSIFDTPDFIYTVTTQVDPVAPGKPLVLLLTATNQTIAPQPLTLTYVVPNYTQFVEGNGSADGPGSTLTIAFGTLAAGATDSRLLKLYVLNGSDTTPANGTLINFVAHDGSRAITFSRTAVVQSAPAADIELSAGQQSVAPGGQFTYELDCRAIGATPLSGATLSLRVPEGAAFVSADGNGALVGATVQWALGAIDPAAPAKLHATFTAPPAGDTVPTLLLEATLTDVGGNILATASDDRSIDALPDFTYVLTTTTDPVAPATDLLLNVTVTNLTNAPQSVTFYYVVPDYTQFVEGNGSADGPGSTLSFPLNQVAGGTSSSTQIKLGVLNGSTTTPPDGTLINVILYDTARNATISRLVTVHSIPKVTSVATATGTVGTSFSYQITATNGPTSFSASGLPDGLTIDPATGLISGVPTTAGTYKVMLGASSVGGTGTQLLTLTVNPAPTPSPTPTPVPTPTATPTPTPPLPTPPVIVAPPTVTATSGEVFFYQIVASNGATSYEAVGLPAGLTLDPVTGIISGTPTVFGTFIVSLTATNAGGSGTFALTLDIAAPAVPTVTAITAGDGKAVESGENGKVAIRRTGDTSLPLTVRYKVVGNVKAGTDYKPTSGTAVIPAGAAQVKIKIKPINDKKHEGMRVAKLKLKPALDGSYSIGGPAAAKVVLIDND